MALVESILQLTPRDNVDAFVESITGRIGAIARVHTLLAEDPGAPSVKKLIESELAPFYRAGQVEIEGDDASAPPAAAQAFAMVLHELATNAAKYGALSAPEGRLTVRTRWQGSNFTIEWIEKAPRAIRPPTQPGFGTRLIKILVEQQIGGHVSSEWPESGLSTRISLTGLGLAARGRATPPERPAGPVLHDLRDRSILVVEDDALTAMTLAGALRDAGAHVRAFNNVEEALSSVRSAPPEFAVLDVNVRGAPVTPVAAALSRRGVPVVYATGYSDNLAELPPGIIIRKPCPPAEIVDLLQRVPAD
jgi:two-component sensor histidine kinase